MQFDPTTLGFNFAKDLAVQLVTLSTGLLALSATFTKEIVKSISKTREGLLRLSWGVYVVSIVAGVWSLMALTGTLMPSAAKAPISPPQFGSNVRLPAGIQVVLFLLGTILLLIVYGGGSAKAGEEEFRVVSEPPDKLAETLKGLKKDRWEVVSYSVSDPRTVIALLRRST